MPWCNRRGGSDNQFQEFRAALEQILTVIDRHLAFTAEHAEPAKHQSMAAKRETLITAYQSALPQIKPDDPGKSN